MRAIVPGTSWSSLQATSLWPAAQPLQRFGQQVIPGGLNGLGILEKDCAAACGPAPGNAAGLTAWENCIQGCNLPDPVAVDAPPPRGAANNSGRPSPLNPTGAPNTSFPTTSYVSTVGLAPGTNLAQNAYPDPNAGISMSTILNAANQQRTQPGSGGPALTVPSRQQVDTTGMSTEGNGGAYVNGQQVQGSAATGSGNIPWGLILLGALGVGGAWWFFRRRK